MKFGKFVAVMVLLVAIFFGVGQSLEADASGAPYEISRTSIPVNKNCTLIVIYYSNDDWTFIESGSGCSKGPIP